MRSSRHQAEAVLCGSNIKQLIAGLITYENENKTFPYAFDRPFQIGPPPGGYPGDSTYDRRGWWWFNYITDYSKKDKNKTTILKCPSKQLRNPQLKYNILCGNYGVNQSICKSSTGRKNQAEFIGTPLSSNDISHPSQTLLAVDSGYSMINWWHVTDAPAAAPAAAAAAALDNNVIEDTAYIPGLKINYERALWPGQEWDAIDGRHPNKTVNVGFADGHVSRIKADDLFVEKTNDGYKNLCPLWLPK